MAAAPTKGQVQKPFFLLDRKVAKEVGGPWFNFKPLRLRPLHAASSRGMRAPGQRAPRAIAESASLLTYSSTSRRVAGRVATSAELPAVIADYILVDCRPGAWYVFRLKLVSAIYGEFPEMKVNWVLWRRYTMTVIVGVLVPGWRCCRLENGDPHCNSQPKDT